MKLITQKRLESVEELLQLDMIDFGRTNGYWEDNIIQAVANWVIDTTVYSVMETDLSRYPTRDNFPGWNHVGQHEELGQLYTSTVKSSLSRSWTCRRLFINIWPMNGDFKIRAERFARWFQKNGGGNYANENSLGR